MMRGGKISKASGLALAAGLVLCAPVRAAHAAETVAYTYDALGRLVVVARTGGVNGAASTQCGTNPDGSAITISGVCTTYAYDAASNRTNVSVAGSANGTGGGAGSGGGGSAGGAGSGAGGNGGNGASISSTPTYVVVPINGFTLIVF